MKDDGFNNLFIFAIPLREILFKGNVQETWWL